MINIAISGTSGKMGQSLIQASEKFAVQLSVTLDQDNDINNFIEKFDVLIDFSRPVATLNYLESCVLHHKRIVIGTTGFSNKQLIKITQYAKQIPIVFSPNMSIGVNLTLKLLEQTAHIIGNNADIEIVETHHRYKVDAPSGTALKMGEVIANVLGRDLSQCAIYGREGIAKPRDKTTIGFSTIRGGDVVGEHRVYFFLDGERIEITHKASSRLTFANGAIKAAIWLNQQTKPGLYNMQDVLNLSEDK